MMKITEIIKTKGPILTAYCILLILLLLSIVNAFVEFLPGIPWSLGIVTAVMSGALITIIYEIDKSRSISEGILKIIRELSYSGEIIKGTDQCIGEIVNALRSAEVNIGREKIFIERVMPIEFTKETCPTFRKEDLELYKEKIADIIVKGKGNYDRTIYGRTKDRNINKAIFEFINDLYFADKIPDTSEIGILPEWNYVTIFLIGESSRLEEVEEWHFGFILFGDGIRPPDTGLKTENKELIGKVLHKLWINLKRSCGDKYWDLRESSNEINMIKEEISKIYK
jgi:hypothetical protein